MPRFSFEYFPPAAPAAEERFRDTVRRLGALAPEFLSVTYGAGGGTQERTFKAIDWVRGQTAQEPAAHLTCVAPSRQQIASVPEGYSQPGLRRLGALRGDPPKGRSAYRPPPEGHASPPHLVTGLTAAGHHN